METFSKVRRTPIIIALVLALLSFPPLAHASQIQEKRTELQSIQRKAETNRSLQAANQTRQAQILQSIQDSDRAVAQLQTQLIALDSQLETTTAQRQAAENKLVELEQTLAERNLELLNAQAKLNWQRQVYEKRLVGIYKLGGPKTAAILLSSRSFGDFLERMALLNRIAKNDAEMVATLKDLERSIQGVIDRVNEDMRATQAQRESILTQERQIVQVKNDIAARQQQFQGELTRQKALLTDAQREKLQLAQAGDLLEASSGMVAEQIRALQQQEQKRAAELAQASNIGDGGEDAPSASGAATAPTSRGFIRPVAAPITSSFGWRFHPILKRMKLHTGIDIGCAYGTPVRAAQGGTVIVAGWMGGYGNAVIIDHGNGVSTLYGHNSSLAASPGDYVAQGQVVSYSGSTGLSTGPHLHFEVRVNGAPVDPMDWL